MPLWSLAVEGHSYLLFLFALLAGRAAPAGIAGVCAAVCGAVLAMRPWLVGHVPDPGQIYHWRDTRIDTDRGVARN